MILSEEDALRLVSGFIVPRKHVPAAVENAIVEKNRRRYAAMIRGADLPHDRVGEFTKLLRVHYYRSLMSIGTGVGIDVAQTIGERITQAMLNSFHAAGLDTGAGSAMRDVENIIDVPRGHKVRRPPRITLFPRQEGLRVAELVAATRHYTTEVTLSRLIKRVVPAARLEGRDLAWARAVGYVHADGPLARVVLDLYPVFKYRIDTNMLRRALGAAALVLPFAAASREAETLAAFLPASGAAALAATAARTRVVGVPGVTRHQITNVGVNRWAVVCEGAGLIDCVRAGIDVYDPLPSFSDNVREMEGVLGVMGAYAAILRGGAVTFGGSIDPALLMLLAAKITHTGRAEAFTRFTMRTNASPLSKISFEESQGGCRNAALFAEREMFKTVSSMVVCGMPPPIGTYSVDVVIDLAAYDLDRDIFMVA